MKVWPPSIDCRCGGVYKPFHFSTKAEWYAHCFKEKLPIIFQCKKCRCYYQFGSWPTEDMLMEAQDMEHKFNENNLSQDSNE